MAENALHLQDLPQILGMLGIGRYGRMAKEQETQGKLQTQQAQANVGKTIAETKGMDANTAYQLLVNVGFTHEQAVRLTQMGAQTGLLNAQAQGQQIENQFGPQRQQAGIRNVNAQAGLNEAETGAIPVKLNQGWSQLDNQRQADQSLGDYRNDVLRQQEMEQFSMGAPSFGVPNADKMYSPDVVNKWRTMHGLSPLAGPQVDPRSAMVKQGMRNPQVGQDQYSGEEFTSTEPQRRPMFNPQANVMQNNPGRVAVGAQGPGIGRQLMNWLGQRPAQQAPVASPAPTPQFNPGLMQGGPLQWQPPTNYPSKGAGADQFMQGYITPRKKRPTDSWSAASDGMSNTNH
jgi:hypothetical protein